MLLNNALMQSITHLTAEESLKAAEEQYMEHKK
jgi:hypothetical protein